MTTVVASGLATIPLQKSQGFSLRRPQKNRWPLAILGLASESQENRSDHGRKSPQPRDFAAAATTGHICTEGSFSYPRVSNKGVRHSPVHDSQSKFTGEWFTSHSNHIHRFSRTPFPEITRGFWCLVSAVDFSGPFSLENQQEKIHREMHRKIHDFQVNFLTKIHSGKFLR